MSNSSDFPVPYTGESRSRIGVRMGDVRNGGTRSIDPWILKDGTYRSSDKGSLVTRREGRYRTVRSEDDMLRNLDIFRPHPTNVLTSTHLISTSLLPPSISLYVQVLEMDHSTSDIIIPSTRRPTSGSRYKKVFRVFIIFT